MANRQLVRNSNEPMTKNPEVYAQYRELLEKNAKEYGLGIDAFCRIATSVGVKASFNFLRDRYYGRTVIQQKDIDMLNLALNGEKKSIDYMRAIDVYRASVEKMCRSCANDDKEPTCWDKTCPLRPVSPLPLRDYSKASSDGEDEGF